MGGGWLEVRANVMLLPYDIIYINLIRILEFILIKYSNSICLYKELLVGVLRTTIL